MGYVIEWARAFALTAAIEIVIAMLLFTRVLEVTLEQEPRAAEGPRPGVDPARLARLGALIFYANLASHPAVWFVFPNLGLSYPTMVLAAELWAVASEAVFYWLVFCNFKFTPAAGVSLVANGSSFGIGLLVREWTGWV
jgi:hypothetical protein